MIDNDVLKVLITEDELHKRVYELGDQLTKDYSGKDVVVISVLKGSIMFMADLLRAFNNHVEIDFMVVSSYGAGVVSTGAVKMIKDVFLSIEGKDVLIVEDILDTGRTLHYIKEYLQGRKPNSIRICTLLDKPERREADISADYVGFTVPDEFVIGYGLDFNEKYRNLPYIGVLKPSLYE